MPCHVSDHVHSQSSSSYKAIDFWYRCSSMPCGAGCHVSLHLTLSGWYDQYHTGHLHFHKTFDMVHSLGWVDKGAAVNRVYSVGTTKQIAELQIMCMRSLKVIFDSGETSLTCLVSTCNTWWHPLYGSPSGNSWWWTEKRVAEKILDWLREIVQDAAFPHLFMMLRTERCQTLVTEASIMTPLTYDKSYEIKCWVHVS